MQVRSRTEDLTRLRQTAVARGVSVAYPIFAERAEGARLWDTDGKEYLDLAGGIGVMNLGHRHPKIVAALQAQLERFTHTCFQVAMYDGYVEVCDRLNRLAPGTFAKKSVLFSSGAEAVENAVKIARSATGRPGIISFQYGYHGRTLLTLTMTGKVAPYKQNFGPYAPDVYHAPYPYAFHGWSTQHALDALQTIFETEVPPSRVAAIVIEPVLGEGGFVSAPIDFMRALRRICDDNGIVLVADEIQTGFGRTGTMFASEQLGFVPDLMTVAKSIAGGLPLSAVVGRAELLDAVEPGGLGGTYAGNPLACAAALATFDVFEEDDILTRAKHIGRRTRASLDALAERYPQIGEARGLGAMQAIEFIDTPERDDLGRNLAKQVVDAALSEGLILLTCGYRGNVVRFLTPLVIGDPDLDEALARFERSCAAVLGASHSVAADAAV